MRRLASTLLISLCALVIYGTFDCAQAQVATGSISGSVVDQSGAAVPGAAVTAASLSNGITANAETDKAGIFKLGFLPIGQYTITIAKTGFQSSKAPNVYVAVNADTGLGTVVLHLGTEATTVEVTATPPLIESTTAQVTNTFDQQTLQTFPGINENQGMDFLALQIPGVVSARDLTSFVNYNGVSFSVNGLRGHDNDQQVDGQNNNDNSLGGPALFVENTDFVSEYQIVSSNFGPEYGRNAGSVVNEITRSGTNQWHGTGYLAETNAALQTLTNQQKAFLDLKKVPHFNEVFPSATIGGPAWKDRVFVFGGFDTEVNSSTTEASSGQLTPTPMGVAQLANCWPNSNSVKVLQSYGPFGITGGNPQVIPGTTSMVNYPGAVVANDGGTGCNVQLGEVERQISNSVRQYDAIYKTDVVLSNSDRFFGRYILQKSNFFNAFGSGAAGYPVSNPALSQIFLFDWTHTFSGRAVNEFRASFGRENTEFGSNTLGTVPDTSQIGNALAYTYFTNTSLLGFGPQAGYPQGRIVNTYQAQDNFSFTTGRHQLKAGIDFTFQRTPSTTLPYYNGLYEFTNWGTFAANEPLGDYIVQGDPQLNFKEYDTFLYFGDDWKIKNNLTLNLGLTWSYDGQPFNLLHNLTVKQQTGPDPFWNPTLPLSDTTLPSLPSIRHLFGPGVGFAWSPQSRWFLGGGDKTAIRGGYRMAFDPGIYAIYLEFPDYAPLSFAQVVSGTGGSPTPGLPVVPTGVNVRNELASYLTPGVFDPRSFSQVSLSPNFRPDTVSSWSLGIQRELVRNAVVEVRYIGNHATNLLQQINANPYIAGLAAAYPNLVPGDVTPCSSGNVAPAGPSSPATGRLNCNEGKVSQFGNTGYSDYEALQSEVRTGDLFHQLMLMTAYTFSKTTDNTTDIFSTGSAGNTTALAQNVLNYTSAEHGLSGLDIPNDWTVSFYEEIPFAREQRGMIGHVLGGWAVSGTYVVASGQPYTPTQDFLNTFTGGVANDYAFNFAFAGTYDTSRPFWGNAAAPANSVGIYAGDACAYTGVGCSASPTELISYNAVNASGTVVPVSASQVRYIANGGTADSVFNTPFGDVPRNAARDYWTNIGNFSVYKTFKMSERTQLQWHMTMANVFNHPNFGAVSPGVDPNIEDAGLTSEGVGFGTPALENGGFRQIFFGAKVIF